MDTFTLELQETRVIVSKEGREALECYDMCDDLLKYKIWFNCLLGEASILMEYGIYYDEIV